MKSREGSSINICSYCKQIYLLSYLSFSEIPPHDAPVCSATRIVFDAV